MPKYSKLKRVYFDQNLQDNEIIDVAEEKLSYLKTVLRLRVQEQFRIFNQQDGEYLAEIVEITRKNMQAKVIEQLRPAMPQNDLILALGIIKQDKFIDAIRGAVQLGATKIIPVIMVNSQNTASNKLNKDRINKCIIETCEQCESMIIPSLEREISFDDLLLDSSNYWIYFADEEASGNNNLLPTPRHLMPMVLIGPEGGFSNEERNKLMQIDNLTQISLGTNVLRTEIAAISAISIVQYLNNSNILDIKHSIL